MTISRLHVYASCIPYLDLSSSLISFCAFLIYFASLSLILNKVATELNTIEPAKPNPAAAVDPKSTEAVTKPTPMRVAPVAMPRMVASRVMCAFLTHSSKNCGSLTLACGSPMSSTSRRTKTWQFLASKSYFFFKVFSHT